MEFATILQSMKTEKKCKNADILGSIGLPQNGFARSLTLFLSSRQNNFEKFKIWR